MKLLSYEHFAIQRRRAGVSQSDIALKIGATQGYIAQVETGKREITKKLHKLYPKKLKSVKRFELLWALLRRAGITHSEAKKLFSVTAREFNAWMRGDTRVPDRVMNYVQEALK